MRHVLRWAGANSHEKRDVNRHGSVWRIRALPCLVLVILSLAIAAPLPAAETAAEVKVSTPLLQRITDWDEYTGRFVPVLRVDLKARIDGYLSAINFVEGALVQQGEVLYTIDARPYEAAHAAAKARLESALAEERLTEIELERARTLLARRVGPEAVVDQRSAEYQQAVAAVALARAELKQTELDLEFTKIVAPVSGRISQSNVDVGDLVVSGRNGGPTLSTVVSIDPIEFEFTISQAAFLRYVELNQAGQRVSAREFTTNVQIQLLDQDDWPMTGRITFIDNRLDPNSGTLLVRATVPNLQEAVLPGVFARVRMARSPEYDGILLPEAAIVADQARRLVYIVNDDNVVEERVVQIGAVHSGLGLRVIRDGVRPDDRVIVSGLQRARPGAPVTPIHTEISKKTE